MKKKVSFLITPNFSTKYINKTFSFTTVKIMAGILLLLVLGIIFMFVYSLKIYYQVGEVTYLKMRNTQLEREIEKLRKIEVTINELEKDRKKLFIMLGLEKIPRVNDFTQLVFKYSPQFVPFSSSLSTDTSDTSSPSLEEETFYPQVPPTVSFFITKVYSKDHPGIDFATSLGKPVFTIADGIVEEVGYNEQYGNYVIIKHTKNYTSFYGHLEDVTVTKGDSVKARDIIGHVGSTGQSTAPHLHFELRHRNVPIDPSSFWVFRRIKIQKDTTTQRR